MHRSRFLSLRQDSFKIEMMNVFIASKWFKYENKRWIFCENILPFVFDCGTNLWFILLFELNTLQRINQKRPFWFIFFEITWMELKKTYSHARIEYNADPNGLTVARWLMGKLYIPTFTGSVRKRNVSQYVHRRRLWAYEMSFSG